MILVIDNYDSFVHNLARYVRLLGYETKVVRNDAVTIDEIRRLAPRAIVLSPGPCSPNEAGICLEIVENLKTEFPVLGICLGHQAIVQAFGGSVVKGQPVHGQASAIYHDGSSLFDGVSNPFQVGRYHSLVAEHQSIPNDLTVQAKTEDGVVMAISHQFFPVTGLQFHPESVLTEFGMRLLQNFFDSISTRT